MRGIVRRWWPPTALAHPSLGACFSLALEVMPMSKRGPFPLGSTGGRPEHVQIDEIWLCCFLKAPKY